MALGAVIAVAGILVIVAFPAGAGGFVASLAGLALLGVGGGVALLAFAKTGDETD